MLKLVRYKGYAWDDYRSCKRCSTHALSCYPFFGFRTTQ